MKKRQIIKTATLLYDGGRIRNYRKLDSMVQRFSKRQDFLSWWYDFVRVSFAEEGRGRKISPRKFYKLCRTRYAIETLSVNPYYRPQ